jgi:hypothetical protein
MAPGQKSFEHWIVTQVRQRLNLMAASLAVI